MAPAELARAGVIVWVPRGGGQMEIVGHEPALMYESDDDAVQKIVGDDGRSRPSRQRLRERAGGHQRAVLDRALHAAGARHRQRLRGRDVRDPDRPAIALAARRRQRRGRVDGARARRPHEVATLTARAVVGGGDQRVLRHGDSGRRHHAARRAARRGDGSSRLPEDRAHPAAHVLGAALRAAARAALRPADHRRQLRARLRSPASSTCTSRADSAAAAGAAAADRRRCISRSATGCSACRGPTRARNITLANSRWTAEGLERLRRACRRRSCSIRPCSIPATACRGSERGNTFLCIGRFHGSKRIETGDVDRAAAARARACPTRG